jgi:inosine/xanthosine triphosphatase
VIVRVGSTRPAKVEGAREALAAIARVDNRFANCTLQSHDLTHIAPRQPMSLTEIIDGARARAAAVQRPAGEGRRDDREPVAFGIGVEGGLHEVMPGVWSLQSWAVVTDGVRWGYGAGPSLVLPTGVAERVRAGEELGDVIDGLAGEPVRGTRGAWGVLTCDLIGRRDAFRLAVLAAFAPFYNSRGWSG